MKIPMLSDDHADYHQALGVFVEMYAATERMTHILLWTWADVDLQTGRAIWPSVRVSVAISIIRRLHEARGEVMPPLIDGALGQLATITTLRDNILHYGTTPDKKGRRVNTEMQSYSEARLINFRVSSTLLNSLTHDLQVIISRFATYPTMPDGPQNQRAYLEAQRAAQTPFLYIPPQPKSKSQPSQKDAPLPKRQRKASRKKIPSQPD